MTDPRFLQIHALTSYPASLLNRDDVGFAKRIPFGGVTRTRISSQCLKRHLRTHEGPSSLREVARGNSEMSIRSRQTFERFLYQPLVEEGIAAPLAQAVTEAMMAEVLGESAKSKKEKASAAEEGGATSKKKRKGGEVEASKEARDPIQTGQITVLGRPELNFLLMEARTLCGAATDPARMKDAVKAHFTRERRENLRALRCGAGLDAALFGRMVTSDILARCDAAIHVAHAFSVHAEAAESDYFSAIDDLVREADELGSGHIGTAELTSGLFYGYFVVDVPLLVSNLSGDRPLAAKVVDRLIGSIATVSPGAKLGSTAPYSYSHWVFVETGIDQPRSLANAFLSPVSERPALLDNTYRAMTGHLEDLDQMYGKGTERAHAAIGPKSLLGSTFGGANTLHELRTWAARQIREVS